jgi:tryptophan 2,3-dioxygenase
MSISKADANWWQFSIDPEKRSLEIKPESPDLRQVNPESPEGRRLLDYRTYLELDRLLGAQVPSSQVPDERCFIITHQLFELVFKLIIFDLAVISETLEKLLSLDDKQFRHLCLDPFDEFWYPALTSANRIKYSTTIILPDFIRYLAKGESKDERFARFNSKEFGKFRSYLPPASGFQTAQFRLIQRAFGKSNLLSVRLFPGRDYRKYYEGTEDENPVSVVDPVILRSDVEIAAPGDESPLARVASLDDCVHRVLARLDHVSQPNSGPGTQVPKIRRISSEDVDHAVERFHGALAAQRRQQADAQPQDAEKKDSTAEATFRTDLEAAVKAENDRRDSLTSARNGAFYLLYNAPRANLVRVLNRLASTDSALHGKQDDSFLSLHFTMVTERIGDLLHDAKEKGKAKPPEGTGGGGLSYLAYMRSNLIPLFPGLIAFLDLESAATSSWADLG